MVFFATWNYLMTAKWLSSQLTISDWSTDQCFDSTTNSCSTLYSMSKTNYLLFIHNKNAIVLRWLPCDWMLAGHFSLIMTVGRQERAYIRPSFFSRQNRNIQEAATRQIHHKSLISTYRQLLKSNTMTDTNGTRQEGI